MTNLNNNYLLDILLLLFVAVTLALSVIYYNPDKGLFMSTADFVLCVALGTLTRFALGVIVNHIGEHKNANTH